MQGPNDWLVNGGEEGRIVDEVRNPMQVNDIGVEDSWMLIQIVVGKGRGEKSFVGGRYMVNEAVVTFLGTKEIAALAGHFLDFSQDFVFGRNVGRCETVFRSIDAFLVRCLVGHQHGTFYAMFAQGFVNPHGGNAGAAGIGICYVQNLHRSNVFVIKSVYVLEYCSIFVVSTL